MIQRVEPFRTIVGLASSRWLVGMALIFGLLASAGGQIFDDPPGRTNVPATLRLLSPAPNGWARVAGDHFQSNALPQAYRLQTSVDLRRWTDTAILLATPFEFIDPGSAESRHRFYRFTLAPLASTNDWANQLRLPDPFLNVNACETAVPLAWAKFAIVLDQADRVYFQDSRRHVLHYSFATQRLAPFAGMTPEQFNAVSLRQPGQQIVLGTVLVPALVGGIPGQISEYGVQFVGQDAYPAESIARWMELVRSAVAAPPGVASFYVPTFEQADAARQNEAWLATRGILLATTDRWSSQPTTVYASGWAVGRLVFVRARDLNAAYADGRLGPGDILLTDVVPAEVPYVAGIISLTSATPASHVAILAANYGVPFFHVAQTNLQQQLQALVGQEVAIRTGLRLSDAEVLVHEPGHALTPEQREQIASWHAPGFRFTPKARLGAYAVSATALTPADLRFFGGKAANFGLLRRAIPEYSPEAMAFSFDLWDDFMDQALGNGQSLREAIQERLAAYDYPPDIASLRASLAIVRDLITDVGAFSPAQQQAVLAAVAGFDPLRKVRFRSSTNVEDSESFTGAGLYDSSSGCPADDLDADTAGPCRCDAADTGERGVIRAIRKVFASFYNENAFLERLRLGVPASQTGMALLVHYSAPDETELANGVVTVQAYGSFPSISGEMVLQPGAASVTNPDNTAAPEIVRFEASSGQFGYTNATLKQGSALLPRGLQAMNWPDDYHRLIGLVAAVVPAYQRQVTNQGGVTLDLEFKKLQPGVLQIKQVREIPRHDGSRTTPGFLLAGTSEWMVKPGSPPGPNQDYPPDGGLLAMHRLKSFWRFTNANVFLNQTNLEAPIFPGAQVEFVSLSDPRTLSGPPSLWPAASHTTTNTFDSRLRLTVDQWAVEQIDGLRRFSLLTELPLTVSAIESPWRRLEDLALGLRAIHPAPVPVQGADGSTLKTNSESIRLFPVLRPITNLFEGPIAPAYRVLITNPVTIVTSLEWIPCQQNPSEAFDPCNPGFVGGGFLFDYVGGPGETRVEGLLSEPLILRSYAAQTLWVHGRTGHETVEEIILDPWLEPDLSDLVKAELTARNIRLLHYRSFCFGSCETRVTLLTLDDQFRRLTPP